MSYIPQPNRELAGITVYDTPLVRKTLEYAKANVDEFTYNHVVRSWIFGSVLLPLVNPAPEPFDHEAFAIATILHDLGWNLSGPLVSGEKRFEVDGGNAARDFLARETVDWDKHRVQLVWDAIVLHTTPSIAMHKEPVVAVTCLGITADVLGPDTLPGNVLSWDTFHRVAREIPRTNFKDGLKSILCQICRVKPETTYDNFVGDYGQKYVTGYTREGRATIDLFENAP